MADAREEALKVIEKNNIGVLSTISGDKPVSRYMTFFNEGFMLYTLTDKRTEKVEDIEQNPNTFILLGYEEGLLNKNFVEIEGKVSTTEDQSLIDHLWSSYMNLIFDGKDDPNILILEIKPEKVSLRGTKNNEVTAVDLT
ncbi:pyridoxamine 5'-phosphate oxidase family protein [Pisciglobus halotolerans]|uniref:General stress protein 26 n=1 Tax=Pisciglobus halotolerans TaxID=745365 RepID=A0A1I3BNY7_9LACT|nr:pyridoxamine 5'-phosphate oxidase family protein [Pisciglobus halotolerans]SFH63967.1 General stress protein 26 [Pisciglobus halotolerans]